MLACGRRVHLQPLLSNCAPPPAATDGTASGRASSHVQRPTVRPAGCASTVRAWTVASHATARCGGNGASRPDSLHARAELRRGLRRPLVGAGHDRQVLADGVDGRARRARGPKLAARFGEMGRASTRVAGQSRLRAMLALAATALRRGVKESTCAGRARARAGALQLRRPHRHHPGPVRRAMTCEIKRARSAHTRSNTPHTRGLPARSPTCPRSHGRFTRPIRTLSGHFDRPSVKVVTPVKRRS